MRKRTWLGVGMALLCMLLVVGSVYVWVMRKRYAVSNTEREVRTLANIVAVQTLFGEKRPLALPCGDVRNLYEWIMARENAAEFVRDFVDRNIIVRNHQTFRDIWGNELVYRFPASRDIAIFDLYSLGPNSEDEEGGGDDIDCGSGADFATWRGAFSDGRIDPQWIRANIGRIQRSPRGGKIIGAPPEESLPSERGGR